MSTKAQGACQKKKKNAFLAGHSAKGGGPVAAKKCKFFLFEKKAGRFEMKNCIQNIGNHAL